MQANMGTIDRAVRVVVAAIVAALIITGVVKGVLAVILGALAAVFLLTSVVSFCPLYRPFGINTGARSNEKPR